MFLVFQIFLFLSFALIAVYFLLAHVVDSMFHHEEEGPYHIVHYVLVFYLSQKGP